MAWTLGRSWAILSVGAIIYSYHWGAAVCHVHSHTPSIVSFSLMRYTCDWLVQMYYVSIEYMCSTSGLQAFASLSNHPTSWWSGFLDNITSMYASVLLKCRTLLRNFILCNYWIQCPTMNFQSPLCMWVSGKLRCSFVWWSSGLGKFCQAFKICMWNRLKVGLGKVYRALRCLWNDIGVEHVHEPLENIWIK